MVGVSTTSRELHCGIAISTMMRQASVTLSQLVNRTVSSGHRSNVQFSPCQTKAMTSATHRQPHCVQQLSSCVFPAVSARKSLIRGLRSAVVSSIRLLQQGAQRPATSFSPSVYTTEYPIYSSWGKNSNIRIELTCPSKCDNTVDVTWNDGQTNSYPNVWLRDNCRCPNCFNADAKARTTHFRDLDLDCQVTSTSVDGDRTSIIINWTDGHISQYSGTWLKCNVFANSYPDPVTDIRPQLWDANIVRDRIQHFDFDDLVADDQTLYQWLREVKVLGISYVKNTPLKERELHRLAERVGYLTTCNYGESFQVKSKVDPSNAAYTSADLALHTDLSYYNQPPGIQMLHCIKQAEGEGGENTLVDGFKIANDLRQTDPELFNILTTRVFEYYDSGSDAYGEFYQHARNKIIGLNHRGEIDRIVFSDHGRSAMMRMDIDAVVPAYKAMKAFTSLLYDPTNVFEYKMVDGDMLTVDNHRILHGRKRFTMKADTSRHLEGSYFSWDLVLSKLRVLQKQLETA